MGLKVTVAEGLPWGKVPPCGLAVSVSELGLLAYVEVCGDAIFEMVVREIDDVELHSAAFHTRDLGPGVVKNADALGGYARSVLYSVAHKHGMEAK